MQGRQREDFSNGGMGEKGCIAISQKYLCLYMSSIPYRTYHVSLLLAMELFLDERKQLGEDYVGGVAADDVVDALLLIVFPDRLKLGKVLVQSHLEGLWVIVGPLEERLACDVVLEGHLWWVVLQVVDPARRMDPSVGDSVEDGLWWDV